MLDYSPDEARRVPYAWPRPHSSTPGAPARADWPEDGAYARAIIDHASTIPPELCAAVVIVARCEVQARVECARGVRVGWRDRKIELCGAAYA